MALRFIFIWTLTQMLTTAQYKQLHWELMLKREITASDCDFHCNKLRRQCRFPDYQNCGNYVHCYISGSDWVAQIRPCGFGTHFSLKYDQCLDMKTAGCKIDRCVNSTLKWYKFQPTESSKAEQNCGKYFECVDGKSKVACCCDGYAFVEGQGCVRDPNCTGSCKTFHRSKGQCANEESKVTFSAVQESETSTTPSIVIQNSESETTTRPPIVIQDSESETTTTPSVVIKNSESLGVSREMIEIVTWSTRVEKDPCLDPEIAKIGHYKDDSLKNHGRRSFWACRNNVSTLSCCQYGSAYIKERSTCVEDGYSSLCSTVPITRFVCKSEPVPGHKRKFILNLNGRKLNQSCACGMRYIKNRVKCGCIEDKDWRNDPECTSCKPEVLLNFNEVSSEDLNCNQTPSGQINPTKSIISDIWTAPQHQKAAVLHGIPIVCSPDDNLKAGKFGSNSYVEIPYFKMNSLILQRFHLEIKFKTLNIGSTLQILVSNCRKPFRSLEVIVDKASNRLKFMASTEKTNTSFSLPYEPFQWNTLRITFANGVLVTEVDPEFSREYRDERILSGSILVAHGGLRIGSCYFSIGDNIHDYFHGFIKYIKIYNCKPEYKDQSNVGPVVP